jgi:CRISPR-associated protein Cmr4
MKTRPYLLHALSPLHAGTGQAVSVIDLPIARMRATGIPLVPGSSIKGVLRDARSSGLDKLAAEDVQAVFGPDTGHAADHAGALVVGDARLLALPVRAFRGTFAWVTSPLLLDLARRDIQDAPGVPASIPPVDVRKAMVGAIGGESPALNVHGQGKAARVYLEDLDLPAEPSESAAAWARFFAPAVAPSGQALLFQRRFVVVDDETMTFLWEAATQIDTRVRLRAETRTVAKGALWVEESLPPETLLIGLFAAEQSRREGVRRSAEQILASALPAEAVLQFGGKATVGRGRCRILPLPVQEAGR